MAIKVVEINRSRNSIIFKPDSKGLSPRTGLITQNSARLMPIHIIRILGQRISLKNEIIFTNDTILQSSIYLVLSTPVQ